MKNDLNMPSMKGTALFFLFVWLCIDVHAQQLVTANNCSITTSASTQIVINGGIGFSGSSSLKDSGTIYLLSDPAAGSEDWTDNVSGSVFHNNSRGSVVMNASSRQIISGPGNFYDLKIRANAGVDLTGSINIRNILSLDTGFVYLSTGNEIRTDNAAINAIQSSSNYNESYIIGKLTRATNDNSAEYLFPVGKVHNTDSLYAPVKFKKLNTTLVNYSVEYIPETPYDYTNFLFPPIDHISNVEYWDITSDNNLNDDAILSLSWRDFSQVSALASSRDSMLIAHYVDNVGVRWEPEMNLSTLNTVTGTQSSGYVTSNIYVSDFSALYPHFTLGTRSPQGILPVQLLSFSALKQNNKALLNWKVSINEQADHFEVIRTTPNSATHAIGQVMARNSAGIISYDLTDNSPENGWNYYQLKLISKDGTVKYSQTEKLFFEGSKNNSYHLFPNPADQFVNLVLETGKHYSIRIVSANGTLISQKETDAAQLQLNVAGLASGTYYVQVMENGKLVTLPFIKL